MAASRKKIFILMISAMAFFLFSGNAISETQNLNVNVTVPDDSSCTDCTVGDRNPPIVYSVSSTPGVTTSTVKWMATDDSGVRDCTFFYGLNGNNNTVAVSTALPGNYYRADLTGLASTTVYTFQVSCRDYTGNTSALATGSFTTLGGVARSLTVLARPEKRVNRPGGNGGLNATLLIYDPGQQRTVFTKAIVLNAAGSSTEYSVPVPVGNNLQAILKGESHLAKKIVGVNIVNGWDLVLDFTDSGHFELLAGDVQGAGLKDNFIDILDVSAVDVKFNSADRESDLNRDGIVDVLDMSVLLVNYNKNGDAVPTT